MIRIIILLIVFTATAAAHNSYTGGYSGALGSSYTCASSCHSSTGGTMSVSGFPASYVPGQTYTITITHTSGNKFINVNATTRLGSSAAVAGSFIAGSNSALYTGADGGIYAPTHLVDQIVFQWVAPAAGSGPVAFYAAGLQGTSTTSSSGQNSKLTKVASEAATGVEQILGNPGKFELLQNYPNPFNPSTVIRYELPGTAMVSLKVYDVSGREVAALVQRTMSAGSYAVEWNASGMSSGLYFARLECTGKVQVQKLVLMK